MDFDEFFKDKAGCYSIESGFAAWEVKNSVFLRNLDMPEAHIQLFIIRGRINVTINDSKVTLQSDTLTDVLHSRLSINDASDNIWVIFIFTTEAFLTNLMKNRPPFPISYIMQILEQPVFLLSSSQSSMMRQRINLLLDLFKDSTHYHQTEMLRCALWMIYMEMSNIFMHQNDNIESPSETDRKRLLFMRFVKMLPLHVSHERSISFYASELFVSCQYLERIVKSLSGETAYQWIQRTLIGEVNKQLKETDKSIQQIADNFGFPDQASFTKYYKRNVRITPTDFRKKDLI